MVVPALSATLPPSSLLLGKLLTLQQERLTFARPSPTEINHSKRARPVHPLSPSQLRHSTTFLSSERESTRL